jgi:Tol biopolymer transport system component
MVKSLDGGVEKSFPVEVDLGWAPMWFPDGNDLLLSGRRVPKSTGQAFYRLDLDSGHVSTLLENTVNYSQPGNARGQRELSADGQTLYASLDWWGPLVPPTTRDIPGGIFALSLSNGQVKKVYETKGVVRAVSISPDNSTLAVIADGKLMVLGTDGATPRTLLESRDVNVDGGVAWSSDGKHVFFVHNGRESELWRVSLSGGDASPTGISGVNIREIRRGPNGALTYTAGRTDHAELWALDNLLPMLTALR